MKIGVIGSGDVAKVLASGFLKHGHDVVIGTRDPRGGKAGRFQQYVDTLQIAKNATT
jgi:predicted dinucleotide-binding enzyme